METVRLIRRESTGHMLCNGVLLTSGGYRLVVEGIRFSSVSVDTFNKGGAEVGGVSRLSLLGKV